MLDHGKIAAQYCKWRENFAAASFLDHRRRRNRPRRWSRFVAGKALSRFDIAHSDLAGATVLLGIERNLLALHQPAHSGAFERGGMNENVLAAVIRLNEAEALLVVVELHGARSHRSILSLIWVHLSPSHATACLELRIFDVWKGLNLRLAFSEGETARLSGQMSIIVITRFGRRLQRYPKRMTGSECIGLRLRAFRRTNIEPNLQFTKRNEAARCFIPKHAANAGKTLTERESAHIGEIGMLAKRERQAVKRNSAAEMVDVVEADVGSEPAQNARKVVM